MAAATADLALSLLSEELIRRVAGALGRRAIPVMLLKGALWRRTLYGRHEHRPVRDVDVIVPEREFEPAAQALRDAGFVAQPNPQGPHEQDFCAPDLPLPVDLHRSLFARGRYALDARGLFARASADEALFGVPLLVPDPRDQLAHLIGHLATDHRPGDAIYRSDFERLIVRSQLSPEAAAEHLTRHGLGRAARFALPELADESQRAWAERCRAALGRDPLGDALAHVARVAVARHGRFSPWSALAGHGLNTNVRRTVQAAAWALSARIRAHTVNSDRLARD